MKEIAPRITADPAVKFGVPVVKGTRVPAKLVLGQLASGMTTAQICAAYDITPEDILAVLAYAAKTVGDDRIRAIA